MGKNKATMENQSVSDTVKPLEPLSGGTAADGVSATQNSDSIYRSPDLPEGFTRLLYILPESSGAELCCTLEEHRVDHPDLQYTALSYAWGPESCHHPIKLNGQEPCHHTIKLNGQPVKVRENLWEFLQHARDFVPTKFQALWIDALCINQNDAIERNRQVGMMTEIYQGATKVLIWLGPSYAGSDAAMEALAGTPPDWSANNDLTNLPGNGVEIYVGLLCHRQYWTRLWVFQEIMVARERVLMCGSQIAPWEPFKTIVSIMRERLNNWDAKDPPESSYKELLQNFVFRGCPAMPAVYQASRLSEKRILYDLILATRGLRCSEPRDRVYAILGIVGEAQRDIIVDYEQPVIMLLHSVLRNHHVMQPPQTIEEVEKQCHALADAQGLDRDAMLRVGGRDVNRDFEGILNDTMARKELISYIWALCHNHTAVQRILTRTGCKGTNDWFVRSARFGHRDTIEVLLDGGLNVDVRSGDCENGCTALEAALVHENQTVTQLLLDRGANVNAQGGLYGNALYAVCQLSVGVSKQVVQMLLDRGADVNARGGTEGNALQAACHRKVSDVIQLLIDRGADVNAQGGYYGNALQAYCSPRPNFGVSDTEEMVSILLDRGADVNAQGGYYGNALQAASCGRAEVVPLLIDRGADVNAQGGYYGNALQAASREGAKEVVQLLIDRGADVNAQGGYYGNALQAASCGRAEVVQLLIDRGADVNAQGGYYGNALQAVCTPPVFGFPEGEKVVQILLDRGADVNAQGGTYGNVLQTACYQSTKQIVQLLVDRGADVNARGGRWGGALAGALHSPVNGTHEVPQILMNAGAETSLLSHKERKKLRSFVLRGLVHLPEGQEL